MLQSHPCFLLQSIESLCVVILTKVLETETDSFSLTVLHNKHHNFTSTQCDTEWSRYRCVRSHCLSNHWLSLITLQLNIPNTEVETVAPGLEWNCIVMGRWMVRQGRQGEGAVTISVRSNIIVPSGRYSSPQPPSTPPPPQVPQLHCTRILWNSKTCYVPILIWAQGNDCPSMQCWSGRVSGSELFSRPLKHTHNLTITKSHHHCHSLTRHREDETYLHPILRTPWADERYIGDFVHTCQTWCSVQWQDAPASPEWTTNMHRDISELNPEMKWDRFSLINMKMVRANLANVLANHPKSENEEDPCWQESFLLKWWKVLFLTTSAGNNQ